MHTIRPDFRLNIHMSQKERVTQRDELMSSLGSHNPRKPGGFHCIPFREISFLQQIQCFFRQPDKGFRRSAPEGNRFFRHIDHARLAFRIQMR